MKKAGKDRKFSSRTRTTGLSAEEQGNDYNGAYYSGTSGLWPQSAHEVRKHPVISQLRNGGSIVVAADNVSETDMSARERNDVLTGRSIWIKPPQRASFYRAAHPECAEVKQSLHLCEKNLLENRKRRAEAGERPCVYTSLTNAGFNPSQRRDGNGRWTNTGGEISHSKNENSAKGNLEKRTSQIPEKKSLMESDHDNLSDFVTSYLNPPKDGKPIDFSKPQPPEDSIPEYRNDPEYESYAPPVTPPDADVDENMKKAKENSKLWFYNQVRNKGPWDYKQQGKDYQNFGNYNYGATGTAAGFTEEQLLRAAGWAQEKAGTSKSEWGNWRGKPPYGDDPDDQEWIKKGIKRARKFGY